MTQIKLISLNPDHDCYASNLFVPILSHLVHALIILIPCVQNTIDFNAVVLLHFIKMHYMHNVLGVVCGIPVRDIRVVFQQL